MRVIVRELLPAEDLEKADQILGQLQVVVALAPFLQHFADPQTSAATALRHDLELFLSDLVADLAIPVDVSLLVTIADDSHGLGAHSFQVQINDRKCRLRWPGIVSPDVPAAALARSILDGIYGNRELCLTRPLTERIREKWLAENKGGPLTGLSPAQFHEFLLAFARRGFRIDRGKRVVRVLREPDSEQWTVARLFEAAIGSPDSIGFTLHLSQAQHRLLSGAEDGETIETADDQPFAEMFQLMQDGLFYEIGIIVPEVTVMMDERLAGNEICVQVNDLRLPTFSGLAPDYFLVNTTIEELALFDISGERALNPANDNECALVQNRDDALAICLDQGFSVWGPGGYLVLNLAAVIRQHAGSFVITDVVSYEMNLIRTAFPHLIDTALKRFDVATLIQVLRDLADEEISFRDLRTILESLLALHVRIAEDPVLTDGHTLEQSETLTAVPLPSSQVEARAPGIVDYVNEVRISLKRYISHKYTRGQNTLFVYALHPDIEARLRDSAERPLTEEEINCVLQAISSEAGDLPATRQSPVILTSLELRRTLRGLIEKEFPRMAVLAYQELSPDMNIQPIARISFLDSKT